MDLLKFKLFFRKNRKVVFLFLVAFFIRFIYFILFSENVIRNDSVEYDGLALNILNGTGFTFNELYSHRPPLYPAFLAIVYAIFGHSFFWVKLIQSILSAVICLFVYLMVKEILGENKWALFAGWFSAVYYALIDMPSSILTETLFTFLLTLSVYFLIRKNKQYVLSGIVLGLATLTRSITLIFPFLVFLWLIVEYGFSKYMIKKFLLFVIPFFFVLLPWTIRNYKIHGKIVPVNIQMGEVFWGTNNPYTKGNWINIYKHEGTKEIAKKFFHLSEYERDRKMIQEGIKFLKSLNIIQLLKLEILKIWYFLFPSINVYDVTFVLIFPFSLLGMLKPPKINFLLYYIAFNFLILTLIFMVLLVFAHLYHLLLFVLE